MRLLLPLILICALAASVRADETTEVATTPAPEPSRHVGIGGSRTLAGVQGVDVLLFPGKLVVDLTGGLSFSSPSTGSSSVELDLAAAVFWPFFRAHAVDVAAGVRLDLAMGNPGGMDTQFQFGLEVPLRLSWWPFPHLGIHVEVGALLEVVPKQRMLTPWGTSSGNDATGFMIGATGLAGGAGFTFLF